MAGQEQGFKLIQRAFALLVWPPQGVQPVTRLLKKSVSFACGHFPPQSFEYPEATEMRDSNSEYS